MEEEMMRNKNRSCRQVERRRRRRRRRRWRLCVDYVLY
jgi:hypothetical protein